MSCRLKILSAHPTCFFEFLWEFFGVDDFTVFIEFLAVLLLLLFLMFCIIFDGEASGILTPPTRDRSSRPALKGEISISGSADNLGG